LTEAGAALEQSLFDGLKDRMVPAYAATSESDIAGFWRVLEGLIPPEDRANIVALDGEG
jgi:hypothetical protein